MNCRKVSHLMSAYMDGELSGVEHRLIHDHLRCCPQCSEEYDGLLKVKRLLSGMRVQEPRPELQGMILTQLDGADNAGAPGWLRNFLRMWRQSLPSPTMLAVGTGLVVVGILFTYRLTETDGDLVFTPADGAGVVRLAPAPLDADTSLANNTLDSGPGAPGNAPSLSRLPGTPGSFAGDQGSFDNSLRPVSSFTISAPLPR